MQRLVEAEESLFQGDATQSAAQQEQAIRAKLERQFGERRLSANMAALSAELPTDLNRDRPNNERPTTAENRDDG